MFAYSISAEDLIKIYPEAVELAKKNGKQPGQDFGNEFFEIAKKYNIKIDGIGETDQDAGLLTGNLREEGIKVRNLNEEMEKENKSKCCNAPIIEVFSGVYMCNCKICSICKKEIF